MSLKLSSMRQIGLHVKPNLCAQKTHALLDFFDTTLPPFLVCKKEEESPLNHHVKLGEFPWMGGILFFLESMGLWTPNSYPT